MTHLFYCNLCWQEFNDPVDHNSGSWLATPTGRVRLDDVCPGDIRTTEGRTIRPKVKFDQMPYLPDAGEPIKLD